MKKIPILGVLAVLIMVSLVNGYGQDKTIDTDTFSIGDEENYVNVTADRLHFDENLENNSANIFIYNNATYDQVTFNISAGPSTDGTYPSDVRVDLGDNGRLEYRFDGYGVGQWGNQTNVMSEDKVSRNSQEIFPSEDGKLIYLKLPSGANVTSTEINMTHPAGTVEILKDIPSSTSNWGHSYVRRYYRKYYYGRIYGYGYGYYYPKSYSDSSYSTLGYDNHPFYIDDDYYYWYYDEYGYGCPINNVYLQWDASDPTLQVPDGATLFDYKLRWPVEIRTYDGVGERTYGLHRLTSSQKSPYSSRTYNYVSPWTSSSSYYYNRATSGFPNYVSNAEDTYTISSGSSSGYRWFNAEYDIFDLVQNWNSGTHTNYGIQISMDSTAYDTTPHDDYGPDYSDPDYYRKYYCGDYRPPSASSSYAPYKPKIHISYALDSKDVKVDVGNDEIIDVDHEGYFNGSHVYSGWEDAINKYLRTHFPDEVDNYGNGWTYVPIRVAAGKGGNIIVSDLDVKYDYEAVVKYNPGSGTLLDELQSLVPSIENGHKIINMKVSSDSEGYVDIKDLKIIGERPNYRPTTTEIPDIETHEGVMDDQLVTLSDHFSDVDQDPTTLDYEIIMNDQEDHVDLFINKEDGTRDGAVYLGIDTSKDENWYGKVNTQVSVMDEFGKGVASNVFTINVSSVNDIPYMDMELPPLIDIQEGVDNLMIEYEAPSGRDVASGKETFMIDRSGAPYFMDIEGDDILMDFQLLDPDMNVVPLEWDDQEGHKIFMSEDNEMYMTVLPPQYTDDPDNWIVLFGSDPNFNTEEGRPYHMRIFVSDDASDLHGQMNQTVEVTVFPINDAPVVQPIPDIVMNEDTTYVSPTPFVEEYVSDVDNDLGELEVVLNPSDPAVHPSIDEDGRLVVELDMDFHGVVPVTMEVSDGVNTAVATFNIRIRSVNDPPVLVIDNLYEEQIISELYRIKGSADDIEKDLRNIEVAVVRQGDHLYADDWRRADGAYVWQYLLDIRDYNEGWHTVFIRGFDGRDFSEIKEFNVYFEPPEPPLPPPPPTLTMETHLSGEQSGNIEVEGTVSDQSGYVDFVEYRVDGSIWRKAVMDTGSEWRLTIDTNTLTNDEHNLSVRAYNGKTYSDIEFQKFDVMNIDSDGDGIPNEVEQSLLMDPFNALDGTMDFDGDGFSNYEELMLHNTDPFDGNEHPERPDEKEELIDMWALIFMVAAILCAVVIIGLFILNVRLERNIHKWREDLSSMRVERRPKTLLQKIVEIAPTFVGAQVPEGPALPGSGVQESGEQSAALPPMPEGNEGPPR